MSDRGRTTFDPIAPRGVRRIRSCALRARSTFTAVFVFALSGLAGREALAHGGNPAIAFLTTPTCTATIAQGECYPIRWLDSDVPIITGTATVQLFATRFSPPTFPAGSIPDDLESRSMEIVNGIREADRANMHCWDTTNVAPGAYFIWSRMNEPAIEMSLSIISWSPGTVTVVAPGEEPAMSVFVESPNSPFRFADNDFVFKTCGREAPNGGGGRVTLEVTPNRMTEENLELIASDLPVNSEFKWNTRCKFEGDWAIKATLTTTAGESFVNWGRYFLLVTHPFGSRDAGGLNEGCVGGDDGSVADPDGGPIEPADAGLGDDGTKIDESTGCDCNASGPGSAGIFGLLLILAFAGLRTRRP